MSRRSRPRVSVILPGKDAGEYLPVTLTSLLRQCQDPHDLEIVMIDDGSQDDTAEVVAGFADRFPHLTVLRNDQAVGLASARNQGLQVATGQYLVYLDADDWLAPGRLSALADAMDGLRLGFVRTDHTTVNGRTRELKRAPQARRGIALDPRESIRPVADSSMVDYPYAWAGMFDSALAQDGFLTFPEGLYTAEDRPWIWNLFLNGPRYAVVDVPTLCYRRGVSGTLTTTYDARQLDILPALRQCLALVRADRESDRFLPKITRTTLALLSHHVARSPKMAEDARARLRAEATELFASMPRDVLVTEAAEISVERRRTLGDLLPAGVPGARSDESHEEAQP